MIYLIILALVLSLISIVLTVLNKNNKQGPPGQKGDTGPRGEPGPQGLPGTMTLPVNIISNNTDSLTPGGFYVITSGADNVGFTDPNKDGLITIVVSTIDTLIKLPRSGNVNLRPRQTLMTITNGPTYSFIITP
jgi:hypothetical protein